MASDDKPASSDAAAELSAKAPLRSLLRLLGPYRLRVATALVSFVLKDLPVWLLPMFTAMVIDRVIGDASADSILAIGLLAAAVVVSNYPSSMLFVRLSSYVFRDVAAQLRASLAAHLQQISVAFHTRTSRSVIQSKLVRDVENIELMLGSAVPALLSGVGLLAGAFVVTGLQVPIFLGVFAATLPISVGIVAGARRTARRRNETFRVEIEELSRAVGEMAQLIPLIRAHALEDTAQERVTDRARRVRDTGRSLDRVNARFAVISWVTYQLLGLCCLMAAALFSVSGAVAITPGQVVLLSSYFALLTGAIVQILGLFPIFGKGIESVRSIAAIFEETDREDNDGKLPMCAVKGEIFFDHVSFRYPENHRLAVSDLSLRVMPGETVAFVGASGSGKTTILSMVMGFIRPTSGRILLDGIDMTDIDLRTFRRAVAVVPQEAVLLRGSVRDNVAYGMPGASDEVIAAALHDANAATFVAALPNGWDTDVGESGSALSGGQRQRIAIARALLRNPKVLLLDEATSALDAESEALVKTALDRLVVGRTTFVVAHRLSTIRGADRIVVMSAGVIVEVGTHDELIAAGGPYSDLHSSWLGG